MIGAIDGGFVQMKIDADCKHAVGNPEDYQGQILRAMELNDKTQSALILNKNGTAMGMFDYDQIDLKFKGKLVSGVVMPLTYNDNPMLELIEVAKRTERKGGYNSIVKNMVIVTSLQRGEFNDNFLFQKQ